ncbi:MAG: 2-hydroxycarboxylate transporter family protein [Lachnospiraceae bacterium]|nr:2-hydroxycarboxylate transporter family protein [Lachnospiraceae bacterium]
MSEQKEKKSLWEEFNDLGGMPLWLYALCAVIIIAVTFTGALGSDITAFIAVCAVIAIIFNKIGKVLPIWNTYIGGGLLMVFFGTAVLKQLGLIPEKYVELIGNMVQGDVNILNVFIISLIMGSILSLDRNVLLRSFGGYIPAILGGLLGACVLGIATGLIFGISPVDMVIKYVLPIMGGGNGAGAVPLSQIYEQISGEPAANYYSFAIIILTIANLFCIVAGALLNRLGQMKPEWTGDGRNIMPVDSRLIKEDIKVKVTLNDYCGALLLLGTVFAVGRLFSKVLLPTIFGASIHNFAYSIIFVVIIAALGIIPVNIRVAAKNMQGFMVSVVGLLTMVGMGVDFDLAELVSAMSPANLLIALMVVAGAIVGSALAGRLVGFYPIDSAVTAGLCMANRGGSGDIAVLGAANRLELISYAQLSSRVGGGIVLIIASFFFSFFL